jgi:hypothetical protein
MWHDINSTVDIFAQPIQIDEYSDKSMMLKFG